jgi:hypothetical protein
MIRCVYQSLSFHHFFRRNMCERLMVYVLLAELLAKIYVELITGQLLFYNPQAKQWIFYALLGMDYMFTFPRLLRMKVTFNTMSAFALVVMVMIAHGAVVGLVNHNPWFPLINDMIPLMMIALNVLRMQSFAEPTHIDFPPLFRTITLLSLASTLLSYGMLKVGLIAHATLIPNAIYLAMFYAALYTYPKMSRCIGGADSNRTTMMFVALSTVGYVMIATIRRPAIGVFLLLGVVVTGATVWNVLPDDSGAKRRIIALQNLDLNSREGSVGERQQEWDSISKHLAMLGESAELTGFGMGGTFTMKFTHEVVENYGHAHYSWAWFKMRFGEIGFVYLGILVVTLVANLYYGIRRWTSISMFIAFICLSGLLYLGTYVNAVWLLSGIQFLWIPATERLRVVSTAPSARWKRVHAHE